jgi:hypothetical protein
MRLTIFLFAGFLASSPIQAKTLWKADFETGDTRQWHWIANPEAASASSECSFDGKFSGKITLSGDAKFLWNGHAELNRSEFHYTPEKGSTHEGKETFYAFSFYLPEAFSLEGRHELGYWESDQTWQQMMRFNIQGEDFSFKSTAEQNPFWTKKNGAKAKQWHKVAMHIFWSTDPKKGFAKIWLDGENMGQHFFQTLLVADADMFNQLGILRNQQEKIETIYIDKVFATDNLTELLETDAHLIGKDCL